MSGVEGLLSEQGYRYLMVSHRSKLSMGEEAINALLDRGVEGFILIAVQLERKLPVPAVVVSGAPQKVDDIDRVLLDHDLAAHLALSHLKDLGHSNIAYFRGHSSNVDADDRWRAIRDAAEKLDLPVQDELTLQLQGEAYGETFDSEGGYAEGYRYGEELLERGKEFTALFAFNDISAIGAMRAFQDNGKNVPEDVSVVGFDDIQSAAFHRPSLTTVRQPLHIMGEAATRLLLHRLSNPDVSSRPERMVLKPRLVARDSTGAAAT